LLDQNNSKNGTNDAPVDQTTSVDNIKSYKSDLSLGWPWDNVV